MQLLVTGASGFVGTAFVRAALAAGHAVRAPFRGTPPAHPDIEAVPGPDLAQPHDWAPLLEGVNAVVHLAGIAHVGPDVAEADYDRVNHRATADLAQAAARAGIRFVFISSIRAQSGPAADHVLRETDPPHPTDAYGRSKLAAEHAVAAAGGPFTILRPVLVYGPGPKGNLGALARLARWPLPLPFARFDNRRSLVGIDNLVAAILFALDAPQALGQTYIVADPDALTLADIIRVLRQAHGHAAALWPLPPPLLKRVLTISGRETLWLRLGGSLVADPGKLIGAGWQPRHDTAAGLRAMVQAASP